MFETYGPEPPPIQQTEVTKNPPRRVWALLIIFTIAAIIGLVVFGCATPASAQPAPAPVATYSVAELQALAQFLHAQAPAAPAVQVVTLDGAAERIADAAQPKGILVDPVACAKEMKVVFGNTEKAADKASKYCHDLFHSGGKIMEKMGNEAADATLPPVIVSPYGYGGYGGYGGGGNYGWTSPVPTVGGRREGVHTAGDGRR